MRTRLDSQPQDEAKWYAQRLISGWVREKYKWLKMHPRDTVGKKHRLLSEINVDWMDTTEGTDEVSPNDSTTLT